MLIDKNGNFWAKWKQTYTRVQKNCASFKKPLKQVEQELADEYLKLELHKVK
jgi:hypothetical protein